MGEDKKQGPPPDALRILLEAQELLAREEINRLGGELDRIMGEVMEIVALPKRTAAHERRRRLLEADFAAHAVVLARYQGNIVPPEPIIHLHQGVENAIAQAVNEWTDRKNNFIIGGILHRCGGRSMRSETQCIELVRRYTGMPSSNMWQPRKEALWLLSGCLSGHTGHREQFRELLGTLFVRLWTLPKDHWEEIQPIADKQTKW